MCYFEDVYSFPPFDSIDPPPIKFKSIQATACVANYLNKVYHNDALEAMQEAAISRTLTLIDIRI